MDTSSADGQPTVAGAQVGEASFIDVQVQDSASLSDEADSDRFDFEAHAERAAAQYRAVYGQYEDFAASLETLLGAFASVADVQLHTLESRAKKIDSFRRKAQQASDINPHAPKYSDPLNQITDLAGVRVITFFLDGVASFEESLRQELTIVEKTDKSDLLEREERLGYHSVHYIVALADGRANLPEYSRFKGLRAEVQVRTILQHAWAEIEHDVQYKAKSALPSEIRRRFMTLAGLLEIADREFQQIQDDDKRIRAAAQTAVESGDLEDVEITAEALKAYLDRRYGSDGRMKDWTYGYTARQLQRMGFKDLDQLEEAISGYNDDTLSRILTNSRQGQLTRFDFVLLASLGELFIERHQLASLDWYRADLEDQLRRIREAGVQTGRGLASVTTQSE